MSDHITPRDDARARLRASDADREAVADHLASALAEGRLDIGEYEQRLSSAMLATTLGDLEPLTADLPRRGESRAVDLAELPGNQSQISPWREWFNEWRYWLGGAIIMIGIWGFTSIANGELTNFWPAIPLGIWAVVIIAGLVWPDEKRNR